MSDLIRNCILQGLTACGDCNGLRVCRIELPGHVEVVTSDDTKIDTRTAALTLVDEERNRQDGKWGEQNHAPQYWVGIIGEEYGEYCQAVNETVFDNGDIERLKGGRENMIRELSHVAATAVGAIECLLRNGAADGHV